MTTRPATAKEVRAHYKALGYDVRIDATEQVSIRRNPDRFPGSPQVWHWAAYVDQHDFDDERGVIYE